MKEKQPSNQIVPNQGGVIRNMLTQVKLIARLMADARVNIFAKLIPVAALAYLVFPFDGDLVLPVIGMVDDAAILWLGSYIFMELCPPEVVAEHMRALAGNAHIPVIEEDVIDSEATEVKDSKQ